VPPAATAEFTTFRDAFQERLNASYPVLIPRMQWSREQLLAHQRSRLRSLLRHVMATSPFHARRLAGIDPETVEPTDLSAIPVMTKAQMMEELDEVFTDRQLTTAEVERALAATGDEPIVIRDRYMAYTTGGSSGVRGVFVRDLPELVTYIGTITRGLVARMQAMGGPPPGGLPMAMIGAACAVHPTGSAQPLCMGGGAPFRFRTVAVTDRLPEIVAKLNEMRPAALFGYPTMLARLAEERCAGRLEVQPAFITSTSETLTPALRAAIQGFGAPIINAFASAEGLVGSSMPDGEVIRMAEDTCIVEVEEDRVLVTNLENRVQPLIRYEINDRFTIVPGEGPLCVHVEGRCDALLRYDGVDVHPVAIRSELVRTPEVLDYQVRQTPTGIDVDVLPAGELDEEDLRIRLEEALETAGLTQPSVDLRAVAELDRDARTGKVARFVALR
jgi:phenylacetate-coenzyme A ligase PaaK-like adenylate-forming protein